MNRLPSFLTVLHPACWALFLAALGAAAQGVPTPTPQHALLKRQAGEWTTTIKSPEGESNGTLSSKLECGGLWLSSDFRGEFAGQKFQGRGLDGYDPAKQKYVSVWVDSMSTQLMLFEGTYDDAKKTLSMKGDGPGPDGTPAKYRNETRFVDDDHLTFTMYLVGADGAETKMMTIEYVRKK
ncbi:MAG: DUF1579 domain-containing protein [Verrucomicrobia bacterium]|nr:DUF1579 domain-containing protein [Verrucomicrobiota bacterium]